MKARKRAQEAAAALLGTLTSPKNKPKTNNELPSPTSVTNQPTEEEHTEEEPTVATIEAEIQDKDDDEDEEATTDEKEQEKEQPNQKNPFVLVSEKKKVTRNKFGRRSKVDPKVKEARDSLTLYVVDPGNTTGETLAGAVIACTGFKMDDWLTNKLFQRGMTTQKQEFCDTTGAIPWVFHVKDQEGNLVFKKGKQSDKPLKCIAIITEVVLGEKELMEMIKDTIVPVIKNNYTDDHLAVSKEWWSDKNAPSMVGDGKDKIIKVDCWSKVLYEATDPFIIGNNAGDTGIGNWIAEDKSHLYQLFEEGTVPVEEYRMQNLSAGLLRGVDKEKYLALKPR